MKKHRSYFSSRHRGLQVRSCRLQIRTFWGFYIYIYILLLLLFDVCVLGVSLFCFVLLCFVLFVLCFCFCCFLGWIFCFGLVWFGLVWFGLVWVLFLGHYGGIVLLCTHHTIRLVCSPKVALCRACQELLTPYYNMTR